MNKQEFRASVLDFNGASDRETEELLAYNYNVFNRSWINNGIKFPLAPEPHMSAWEEYVIAARIVGAFEALKQRLVQLRFPIFEGISQTPAYRAATLKGIPSDGMAQATGLILQQPDGLGYRSNDPKGLVVRIKEQQYEVQQKIDLSVPVMAQ